MGRACAPGQKGAEQSDVTGGASRGDRWDGRRQALRGAGKLCGELGLEQELIQGLLMVQAVG